MPRLSLTKQRSGTSSRKDWEECEVLGGRRHSLGVLWCWVRMPSLLWKTGTWFLSAASGRKGHLQAKQICKDALRIKQLEGGREGGREMQAGSAQFHDFLPAQPTLFRTFSSLVKCIRV